MAKIINGNFGRSNDCNITFQPRAEEIENIYFDGALLVWDDQLKSGNVTEVYMLTLREINVDHSVANTFRAGVNASGVRHAFMTITELTDVNANDEIPSIVISSTKDFYAKDDTEQVNIKKSSLDFYVKTFLNSAGSARLVPLPEGAKATIVFEPRTIIQRK